MLNPILKQYHLQNRYFDIFNGCEELNAKRIHIENVIHFVEKLLDTMPPCCVINKELALFCAEHYMDGWVNQYELFGSFNDSCVSHSCLGVDRFEKWLHNSSFVAPINQDIQVFMDVLLYHDNPNFCGNNKSKLYVTLISGVDNFVTALSYAHNLKHIIETDSKGYIRETPNLNQYFVSSILFKKFKDGKSFTSSKCCTTYAEYTIYCASFMVDSLKKYPFVKSLLLQPGYGYDSILEGYKQLFKCNLPKKLDKKAFSVLKNYCK